MEINKLANNKSDIVIERRNMAEVFEADMTDIPEEEDVQIQQLKP